MQINRLGYHFRLWLGCAVVVLGACGSDAPPVDLAPSGIETPAAPLDVGAVARGVGLAEPRNPVLDQEIAYGEAANRNLNGYLAMPADAVEPPPGLLVVHDRWGLDAPTRAWVRRLAGEGFVVLAVDLFDGEIAESPQVARALMARVTEAPEATLANLTQGYEYLARYALAPKVAAIGQSFGGTWALEAGLVAPGELDAIVVYYGQIVRDESRLAMLESPLLAMYGAEDKSIPVGDVRTFRATLTQLGKDSEVYIYTHVGHGFASPSADGYDAETAEDAWQRALEFLSERLR